MAGAIPVIVCSENGLGAAEEAIELLRQGRSALDAAVAAATHVERDLADNSVGRGGVPGILGNVELDASLMDGSTRRAGAVAALTRTSQAARLARAVLEQTPHVLVVGEGANRLARACGLAEETLEHEVGLGVWRERFDRAGIDPDALTDDEVLAAVNRLTSQLSLLAEQDDERKIPDAPETGTVNFLVRDTDGNLASVVSTSGLGWKHPGRVGDSPVIGAGNYCDNRHGAAACTGMGELCLRTLTAKCVVDGLRRGSTLQAAGRGALRELADLPRGHGQFIGFVALAPDGRHAGFSERPGRTYGWIAGGMRKGVLSPRLTLQELGS